MSSFGWKKNSISEIVGIFSTWNLRMSCDTSVKLHTTTTTTTAMATMTSQRSGKTFSVFYSKFLIVSHTKLHCILMMFTWTYAPGELILWNKFCPYKIRLVNKLLTLRNFNLDLTTVLFWSTLKLGNNVEFSLVFVRLNVFYRVAIRNCSTQNVFFLSLLSVCIIFPDFKNQNEKKKFMLQH